MPDIVDPNEYAAHVHPEGLAAVTLGVCIGLAACSIITVGLRVLVRTKAGHFGLDDGLMVFGLLLYLADCGVVSYDCFVGLGTKNDKLNPVLMLEGIKYVVFWQIFYVKSLCAIKCAICITLLRITIVKIQRILTWGVIIMTCITSLVGFIGVLTACRPIQANWTPGTGDCFSTDVITNLSYLVSASSIVTDRACAILPMFILWKTQMQLRTKISVAVILTLGAIASVTTIARMPFLQYYKQPENDYLYHMGFVIVLSIGECGVGLVAGSLPMLRHLFRAWLGRDATSNPTPPSESLVTWGRAGGSNAQKRFNNPTDMGLSRATIKGGRGSGDWEQLDDTSSHGGNGGKANNRYILEHTAVKVEYEMKDLPGGAISETHAANSRR